MLSRHPFATDAYERGYAVGIREDYTYQIDDLPNVDLPVVILDNDFHDPDLQRYLEQFKQYDPAVAILGDAYSTTEAQLYNDVVDALEQRWPYKEYIVVPKCRDAIETLDEDITLGYPMGYSDIQAAEFSTVSDWRGRDVHLLGAAPQHQREAINKLTQPTLSGEPPADIVGLDWNGMHRGAYKGEYWTPDGWQPADHLSIRETVQHSLDHIKTYWQHEGIWPRTEPIDLYKDPVTEPDLDIYMDRGGDPIPDRDALEHTYVQTYDDTGTVAFHNERAKKFIEYCEDLEPV